MRQQAAFDAGNILCSTIAFLAGECIRVDRLIPRLDSSAVEPLLQYNDWLVKKHNILPVVLPENPLDFPALDIVSAVTSIVEKVCSDEEKRYRSETFSASSDEGFDTMVECNYAVSKYLADGSSEYSTEDLSSYSAGTKSSRSCSPYIGERCFSGGEQQIPTRPHVKLTSQVAHNPLQFVSSRTTAVALCEQAKQQMIVSEEQRRNRAEALKMMRCSSNVDEEPAWQSNLDSWLSKRKSAISKSRRADAYPTPSRTVPQVSDTRLVMAKLEPRSASTGDYELKIVNSMPNVGVLYSSDLRSPRLDSYKVLSGAQNPGFYPAVYPQEYFIARYPSNNIRNGPNECRVEAKHDLVGMNHTDTQEGSRWYIGASMTPQEGNEWNFFERWRALTAKDKGTTSNISEPEHLDAHQFLSLSGKASGRNSNSKNESEILNDVLKTYQKCIDCAKLENAKSGTKVTEGYCCICEKDLYHDTGTEPSAVLRIYVAPVRTLHLLKCPLKLFEH
ncbi:hypothetical protein Tcan_04885 [Toxocara canis]|uniref:Uncharacterized protein n=1 Tax=Toxocara canis TaxID=6265 RepID=A0A0B2VZ25_TOXCA|nr:hypothetical protein Tcan_04885 [Toxocara canis]